MTHTQHSLQAKLLLRFNVDMNRPRELANHSMLYVNGEMNIRNTLQALSSLSGLRSDIHIV